MSIPKNISFKERILHLPIFHKTKTPLRGLLDLGPKPRLPKTPKRFTIFGQGRTGSTLLVELLHSNPNICSDGEILNHWINFPHNTVKRQLLSCNRPVYGFKLLSYHLDVVLCYEHPERMLDWLASEGFKMVYLKRENILLHALSQINARERGFHQREGHKGATGKKPGIEVKKKDLFWWIERMESRDEYEKRVLVGRDYLPLIYERDLERSEQWFKTIDSICEFLEIDTFAPSSSLRKVTPSSLNELVLNYDELRQWLKGTQYHELLT